MMTTSTSNLLLAEKSQCFTSAANFRLLGVTEVNPDSCSKDVPGLDVGTRLSSSVCLTQVMDIGAGRDANVSLVDVGGGVETDSCER